MKTKVAIAVLMALMVITAGSAVQAAEYADVVIRNNTDHVAYFEIRRGNGRPIGLTEVVRPGEFTKPLGGDPKKFKIKAFVWGEWTEQWRSGTYWIPFANPGGYLMLEYHYTGNGSAMTLSEMFD
jgi:hypothetical protein